MGEYLDTLMNSGVGINVVALVGHGAVRKAVMRHAARLGCWRANRKHVVGPMGPAVASAYDRSQIELTGEGTRCARS